MSNEVSLSVGQFATCLVDLMRPSAGEPTLSKLCFWARTARDVFIL